MNDDIGRAERSLGSDGFLVFEASEASDELVITIETTADFVGCSDCGVRAEFHGRGPSPSPPCLLRAASEVGVDQAAAALPRGGLRDQDLDRVVAALAAQVVLSTAPAPRTAARWANWHAGVQGRRGVQRVLVDADECRGRNAAPAGRWPHRIGAVE